MNRNNARTNFSPSALFRIARRRMLYLVLPVLILTPAVVYFAAHMPRNYRAQALVGTTPEIPGNSSLKFTNDAAATINAQDQLRAIRETLLSRPVLESAIREFDLYKLPKSGRADEVIDQMRSRVQVQVDAPDAFYIGFEGKDPRQVADVANRLAQLFVERTSDLRGEQMAQQDDFLDGEVDRLRQQLNQQENSLKDYKQRVAEMLPDRLATNLKQIETLQQQIQAKSDQITEAEGRKSALLDEVHALEKQGGLDPKPPDKTPTQLALDDLRMQLNQLKTRYTPEHPEIKRVEKEIQDLEASNVPAPAVKRDPTPIQLRYFSLQAELRSIEPMLKSYRQERDSLRQDLDAAQRKTNATPRYETVLAEQTRDVSVTRSRYEALLAKQQEAKLAQRAEKTTSRPLFKVLEPADTPTAPAGLQPKRVMLLGIVASLGLGVLGVFLAERLDSSFDTSEDVEGFANIPVLASVPSVKAKKPIIRRAGSRMVTPDESTTGIPADQQRHMRRHGIVVPSEPVSVAAQQYGVLALKVRQWSEKNDGRIITVTSGTGEEGKSLTALNLSFALAASTEQRVLLIDCDLHLPQEHERLGLTTNKGLGDLLTSNDSDFCPYITRVGNLNVMAGGLKPDNPVGLLSSPRARAILMRLREEFRYIILDAPPIIPLADSHILAGLSDGLLLVVRARKTRSELLRRAVESLDANNIIGVVLNDVQYADAPYAYAYRYYQRHYVGRS